MGRVTIDNIRIKKIFEYYDRKADEELVTYHVRNWFLVPWELQRVFSGSELDDIFKCVRPLPKDETYCQIDKFLEKCCDLRITSGILDLVANFPELAKSFALEPGTCRWILSAFLCFERLLESHSTAPRQVHCENWWSVNLWADLFDSLMLSIDGLDFERYVRSMIPWDEANAT